MTNKEAYKWLYVHFAPCGDETKQDEAINIALEALAKQIPKKVRITTSTKRCATCGRQLSGIGNIHPERNYCQRCGQAIDWTEDE